MGLVFQNKNASDIVKDPTNCPLFTNIVQLFPLRSYVEKGGGSQRELRFFVFFTLTASYDFGMNLAVGKIQS